MTEVRGTHPWHFRAGSWAEIDHLTIENDRLCYFVLFPDGETDLWVVEDDLAGYEYR